MIAQVNVKRQSDTNLPGAEPTDANVHLWVLKMFQIYANVGALCICFINVHRRGKKERLDGNKRTFGEFFSLN